MRAAVDPTQPGSQLDKWLLSALFSHSGLAVGTALPAPYRTLFADREALRFYTCRRGASAPRRRVMTVISPGQLYRSKAPVAPNPELV
jgi:hypothetical protein